MRRVSARALWHSAHASSNAVTVVPRFHHAPNRIAHLLQIGPPNNSAPPCITTSSIAYTINMNKVRPGLSEASMTARMAATLDRLSGGRVLINVVAGGDPVELHSDGVWLDHAERYEATGEYLTVWRRLMRGEMVDFEGRHMRVQGG